ncbi:protein kinase [Micromonospora aurantiaca]|uniref:protein kinase domain-containing protein n=1 Tax=Micromonospora aurantiaca (nom. illeg.) TaxID=47850 RepID=UPI003402D9EA
MTEPTREARRLFLDFECLRSIPEGINEVHVWYDAILQVERVGKLIDISGLEQDGSLPEPATLQAIDHPNIVPVVTAARRTDYAPPLNVVELITPYYPRGSITDALLRGEGFNLSQALAIAQASLQGLSELHDVVGVLHRDVKSGNILLTEDSSKARVADLGLAAKLDPGGHAVTANNPTLYSPPEFMGGALTTASDIYSFGLVLHELIAGPFDYASYTRSSVIERLSAGSGGVPDEALKLPLFVPKALRQVLKKATSKGSAKRYQTAREMSSALARVVVADWEQVDDLEWVAPYRHHSRRSVSVRIHPRRDGSYTVTARTHTVLRSRSLDSVRVTSIDSPETVRLFDRATEAAVTR